MNHLRAAKGSEAVALMRGWIRTGETLDTVSLADFLFNVGVNLGDDHLILLVCS